MQPSDRGGAAGNGKALGHDLVASIVVFLVALPLCMAIAIASGAPVAAGLVTGIIGGIVVGAIGGAPLQVSGPAAGLTVIVYEAIQAHGLPILGVIVLTAGIFQMIAGILRLGQWFRAVSPAVIEGMLAGIGVLIIVSQLHVLVDDKPRATAVANLQSLPEAFQKGLPLPRWESAERRRQRVELLRDVGALHEDQVEIEERIDETVAAHDPHLEPGAESPLALYRIRQQAHNQRLAAIEARLRALGSFESDHQQDKRLSAAVAAATEACRQALEDLDERRLDQVRDSQRQAVETLAELLSALKNHEWAAKIGILSIVVIILWQAIAVRWVPFLPGPLVAVLAATVLAAVLQLPILYVEVPAELSEGIHLPTAVIFQDVSIREILLDGLLIAVIASAETLLCATAVDQMQTIARTKYDRELFGQGVGNLISGFLGGLPMTGVIVRSAANVHAGARTRRSAILHGVWLLVTVVFFRPVLTMIPTAALAGVLVYTGYKLIHPRNVRALWRAGKGEVFIYFATLTAIVVEDLLTGVILGIVLSALKLLISFSSLRTLLTIRDGGRTARLYLEGAATFLRLPLLAAELERVPRGAELHVDFNSLDYIDHACLELLINWAKRHESEGGTLSIDWEALHARFHANGVRSRNARKEKEGVGARHSSSDEDAPKREGADE